MNIDRDVLAALGATAHPQWNGQLVLQVAGAQIVFYENSGGYAGRWAVCVVPGPPVCSRPPQGLFAGLTSVRTVAELVAVAHAVGDACGRAAAAERSREALGATWNKEWVRPVSLNEVPS